MCDHRPRLPPFAASILVACAALGAGAALAACVPDPVGQLLPPSDLKPPLVLEAGPEGSRNFFLRFDEEVRPVAGSFSLEPGPYTADASAEGESLRLAFPADLEAGADYAVSGEVEDAAGNATRFLFSFVGWNGHPAKLRLSEAQTAKNSSVTRPHRDYLELKVEEDGNIGGLELSWASSVKRFAYRFPGVEVRAGDFIVLHLAPMGIPEEKDERGIDLAESGGVDATPHARDFWCQAGGLPDANGALALRTRPGGPVEDGLFYADQGKTGPLGADKLADLVAELAPIWPFAAMGVNGAPAPAWEDAFRWKPSSARSICRSGSGESGPTAWYLCETSGQSPGAANP